MAFSLPRHAWHGTDGCNAAAGAQGRRPAARDPPTRTHGTRPRAQVLCLPISSSCPVRVADAEIPHTYIHAHTPACAHRRAPWPASRRPLASPARTRTSPLSHTHTCSKPACALSSGPPRRTRPAGCQGRGAPCRCQGSTGQGAQGPRPCRRPCECPPWSRGGARARAWPCRAPPPRPRCP